MAPVTRPRTAGPAAPPSPLALAWVTLAALGLRGRHVDAVRHLGGPERALGLGGAELLRRVPRPPRRLVAACERHEPFEEARAHAARAAEWCRAQGGAVVTPGDLGRVARAPGAPLCAFVRGPVELLHRRPAVGIVGSRDASARGLARARSLADDAAAAGALVVSGGARGVDLAAHAGALAAGGETVFVLGDPVRGEDDERPRRVRDVALAPRSLTLTAHGPWTPPTPRLWVARNAVLAALCDAVVVVEGRARSGTRHTAEAAAAISVPVLVVPGDPEEETARTPNALLKMRGARPLLSTDDMLELLGRERPARREVERQPELPLDLAPGPRRLLEALHQGGGAGTPDALARSLGVSPAGLLSDAVELELRGLLQRAGASWRAT